MLSSNYVFRLLEGLRLGYRKRMFLLQGLAGWSAFIGSLGGLVVWAISDLESISMLPVISWVIASYVALVGWRRYLACLSWSRRTFAMRDALSEVDTMWLLYRDIKYYTELGCLYDIWGSDDVSIEYEVEAFVLSEQIYLRLMAFHSRWPEHSSLAEGLSQTLEDSGYIRQFQQVAIAG